MKDTRMFGWGCKQIRLGKVCRPTKATVYTIGYSEQCADVQLGCDGCDFVSDLLCAGPTLVDIDGVLVAYKKPKEYKSNKK